MKDERMLVFACLEKNPFFSVYIYLKVVENRYFMEHYWKEECMAKMIGMIANV